MEFIESLNPKLMRALVKKHADLRTRPQMLQQAFNKAEEASRRILETESFQRSSRVRFMGSANNIYQRKSEVNEVSHGRYNSNNYKGGYSKSNYKVKTTTIVRRIGTKTPKVPTKRQRIRKNPRTRMCT